MPSPEEKADAIMAKIGPLREVKIRTAVLARELKKLSEDMALEVFRVILQRGFESSFSAARRKSNVISLPLNPSKTYPNSRGSSAPARWPGYTS
jgi:hypothetical protein